MDKKAAAEFLGVSTRTIENYASDGKISVTYALGKNRKQAEYKEDELRALKEELETPVHRSVVAPNTSEIASSEVFGGLATLPPTRVVELLEALTQSIKGIAESAENTAGAQRLALLWSKLVWNLEEAATATGYSRFHLRQAIALGNLRAQKVGKGWKIRPSDLREYTGWIWNGR